MLGFGLTVAAIGMGVVFSVLVLLYGLMVLIGRFGGEGRTRAAPMILSPENTAGPAAGDPAAFSREQLAAVIAAAVAATTGPQATNLPAAALEAVDGRAAHARRLSWVLSGRFELLTARERLPRG